jgi:hypothetical protein
MKGRGSSSASLAHTLLPGNRRRKPCKKRNCPDQDTHRQASTRPAVLFTSFIEHSSVLDTNTDARALQLPISDWSGAASDLRICICRVSYDTVVLTVVRAGRTLEQPSSSTRETRNVHPPTCSNPPFPHTPPPVSVFLRRSYRRGRPVGGRKDAEAIASSQHGSPLGEQCLRNGAHER